MQKILFLCGSPRGRSSASLSVAQYMAHFLDYEYEFLDVVKAKLSIDPKEAGPVFLEIIKKIKEADAVIWVFGAYTLFVPVQMQYLFDKLFSQDYNFTGKIAASVMTSIRIADDYALERMKFVSEQLGFSYIGDVSAEGSPFYGYIDEEETEGSCRILAGRINRALTNQYLPSKDSLRISRNYLSSLYFGKGFEVNGPQAKKEDSKTILVITGNRLVKDPIALSIAESLKRYSRNNIEIIELESYELRPCLGCYSCVINEDASCVQKDEYEKVKQRLLEASGIVYIGNCASGMVDAYLKTFLDRLFIMLHRPLLKGKYGFAVANGGGPLSKYTAEVLRLTLEVVGVKCITKVSDNENSDSSFANTVRRTIEDLDQAIKEKWRIADRFIIRGIRATVRDNIAQNSMILQADYVFYKKNKMFNYPSYGAISAILRFLFKNSKIANKSIVFKRNRIMKAREKRLELHLKNSKVLKKKGASNA